MSNEHQQDKGENKEELREQYFDLSFHQSNYRGHWTGRQQHVDSFQIEMDEIKSQYRQQFGIHLE